MSVNDVLAGTAEVIQGNALDLPMGDNSVDVVITSPPSTHYQRWRAHGDPDVVKTPGRKPTPTPKAVVQCVDCGAVVGLTEDPRGIWALLAAHTCEAAA